MWSLQSASSSKSLFSCAGSARRSRRVSTFSLPPERRQASAKKTESLFPLPNVCQREPSGSLCLWETFWKPFEPLWGACWIPFGDRSDSVWKRFRCVFLKSKIYELVSLRPLLSIVCYVGFELEDPEANTSSSIWFQKRKWTCKNENPNNHQN